MDVGRPEDYTQELADIIIEKVADGIPMRKICEPKDMPHKVTVYRWLSKHDEFRNLYAQAKEDLADDEVEEIKEIADEMPPTADGRIDHGYVSWQKNRIDARKWRSARYRPKKYGDKVDVTSGGDKLQTPPTELRVIVDK